MYSAIAQIHTSSVGPNNVQWSNQDRGWFHSLMGYIQLAPPSPQLVSPPLTANSHLLPNLNHSRYMRLNIDEVINEVYQNNNVHPVTANLFYERSNSIEAEKNIFYKLAAYAGIKGVTTGYHGVEDVYISDSVIATDMNNNKLSMKEFFKKNIIEVANELQDNCKVTFAPSRIACQVWSRGNGVDGNYEAFSLDGTTRAIELITSDPLALAKMNWYCSGEFHNNGYDFSTPGRVWCSLGSNKNISIKTLGGDVFNYTAPSVCVPGETLPHDGILTI